MSIISLNTVRGLSEALPSFSKALICTNFSEALRQNVVRNAFVYGLKASRVALFTLDKRQPKLAHPYYMAELAWAVTRKWSGPRMWFKRAFDATAATTGLVLASPIMSLTSKAIKIADREGAPVFIQKRLLHGDIVGEVLKFRSMYATKCDVTGLQHTVPNDPRFLVLKRKTILNLLPKRDFPLGSFIRRTSIDELMQFHNIRKGHMAIVGPRASPVSEFDLKMAPTHPLARLKLLVPQGFTVTGNNNTYRGDENLVSGARILHDLEYVRFGPSIRKDFRILWVSFWEQILKVPTAVR